MDLRSARRLRSALTAAAIIALLALSTGSVAASTPGGDGTFTQNGKTADVSGGSCVSNGDATTTCTNVGLFTFTGKMSDSLSGVTHSNQVCVILDTYTIRDETGQLVGPYVSENGCRVDLPNGSLTFGSGLSAATLAPMAITIVQLSCTDKFDCTPGTSREITINGTWLGSGPVVTSKYRSSGSDGICRYAESSKGSSREASFTGMVDGSAIEGAYASLRDSKTTYRSRCSEV